jgi:hypothetical protein
MSARDDAVAYAEELVRRIVRERLTSSVRDPPKLTALLALAYEAGALGTRLDPSNRRTHRGPRMRTGAR